MILHFKSWVPNVTGHLSFSVIGNAQIHSRPKCANEADRNVRYLVCYQRRVIGDAIPDWNFLSKRLFRLDGEFWCVCIARTHRHEDDQFGELRGRLYLFRDKAVWSPVEAALNGKIDLLRKYKFSPALEGAYEGHRLDLDKTCVARCMYVVDFSLYRTGLVSVSANDDLAELGIVNFPSFKDGDAKLSRIRAIAAQLFYFLKDISHIHKHHNPRTDTIVDLHEADVDGAWCREVIYSLYRKVINERRLSYRSAQGLSRALGVMSYAETFANLLQDRIKCNPDLVPDYRISETKDSVNALISEAVSRSERRWTSITVSSALVLGLIGILISMAALVQTTKSHVDVQPSQFVQGVISFSLIHTYAAVTLVLIMLALLNWAVLSWSPGWYERLAANVVRLGQVKQRTLTVAVFLILGVSAFALSFWAFLKSIWLDLP